MKREKMSARSLSFGIFSTVVTTVALNACSPAGWKENPQPLQTNVAPLTGDPVSEHQIAPIPVASPKQGQTVLVVPDHLCGRRIANKGCQVDDPVVEKGDQVEIVDPTPEGPDQTVKVIVKKTSQPAAPVEPIYLPLQYLTDAPATDERPAEKRTISASDRFFVVQNIATEKLRVYENCLAKSADKLCKHRLVLETDMVVGEDMPGKRTRLGSYRITQWHKFYQDHEDSYPAWFREGYPQLPAPGSDLNAWTSPSLLPKGKGAVRGSFGWYTAFVGPNADEQWLHGTWGWGQDGDKFIKELFQAPAMDDIKLASHGCTRVENQAIAFMREILPADTKLIRIYAREAMTEPPGQAIAPKTWNWILTNEASGAPTSGKGDVINRGAESKKLEGPGSFQVDMNPVAVPLRAAGVHQNGNIYKVDEKEMNGYFVVDSGRLVGYAHPKSLKLGGMEPRTQLPGVALAPANTQVAVPKVN